MANEVESWDYLWQNSILQFVFSWGKAIFPNPKNIFHDVTEIRNIFGQYNKQVNQPIKLGCGMNM